jgi:hypothetical protein
LILFGVSLLLKKYSGWLVFLATAVVLGICLWISIAPYGTTGDGGRRSIVWNQPTESIQELMVGAEFRGVGVSMLGAPPENDMVSVSSPGSCTIQVGTIRYTSDGKTGRVNLPLDFPEECPRGWEIRLTESIPLDMLIDAELSELRLRLAGNISSGFRLKSDLSNCVLELPAKGDYTVDIDGDLSNIEIVIPENMPAMITADVNLGILEFDRTRFKKEGDSYVSPGYLTAVNRVKLVILCDLSRVKIR